MKIGLCLGGGGSRGLAAIPMIRRLQNENIKFSMISGCSIGSILGTYLACFGSLEGLEKKIRSLRKRDFLRLVDVNPRLKPALIKGNHVKDFFYSLFQHTRFQDLETPLIINGVDLETGETRYFNSGYVVDAIMASIALPGIFPPAEIGGHYYIDGGITCPLPHEVLFQNGMKKVLAINLSRQAPEKPDLSLAGVLLKSFSLVQSRLSEYENSSKLLVLEPEFPEKLSNILRFHDYEAYARLGESSIAREIQNVLAWI